jgi:hypothetical protein
VPSAAPPSLVGAVHVAVIAVELVAVRVRPVGAPGMVAGVDTVAGAEGFDVPAELETVTVTW